MAVAKRIPGVVVPTPPPADKISLELSIEEAVVLKALLGSVGGQYLGYAGGSPRTVRVQTDAIAVALDAAGIAYPSFEPADKLFNVMSLMANDVARLPKAVEQATAAHLRRQEEAKYVPLYSSVGKGIRFP